MSSLQPFIQTASIVAYLFTQRLNQHEEFSRVESDISNQLREVFFDGRAPENNLIKASYNVMFAKQNLEMFMKMVVLMVNYKNLATVLFNYFDDVEKAKHALEKNYQGDFANKLEFTYHYVEKFEPFPENLDVYIDYERLTQDLFMNMFYAIEVSNRTHVFQREY